MDSGIQTDAFLRQRSTMPGRLDPWGVCALAAAVAAIGLTIWPGAVFGAGAAGVLVLLLVKATPAEEEGTVETVRFLLLGGGALLLLLAGKDLIPLASPPGATERQAALAVDALRWPATARSPGLGTAAAQLGALALALCMAVAVASALAGRVSRQWVALGAMAWALAGFGAAVASGVQVGQTYGPGNAVGAVVSKNSAATLVALGVVLHAGLARLAAQEGRVWRSLVHLSVAALLLAPLLRLGSWTGLLALAAGGTALVWRRGRAHRHWLALLSAGAAVLLLAAFHPILSARVGGFLGDYRLQIWRDCLPMLAAFPLGGIGLGGFAEVYPLFGHLELPYDARLAHPDSSWVRLVLEWGLLPMGLAGAAAGLAWRRLRPEARESAAGPAVAAAAAVAWLASGLTDNTLHRPETLVPGALLLGQVLAGSRERIRLTRRWRVALLTLLGLAAILLVWADQAGRRDLAWGPLDPTRLWTAATQAEPTSPPSAIQLERLHAAVRLQHRSVSYPMAAARFLHRADPEAAFPIWRTALERAGPREGGDFFRRAREEFPATADKYWIRLAQSVDPDLVLLVRPRDPAEMAALIADWLAQPRAGVLPADRARWLLSAVGEAGRPDLLAAAIAQIEVADQAFWRETARRLRADSRPTEAWAAVGRILPVDPEPAGSSRLTSPLSWRVWLETRRYPELREWLLTPGRTELERRTALVRICATPGAPAWFRMQHARMLAAVGDHAAAVDQALTALEAGTPPRL